MESTGATQHRMSQPADYKEISFNADDTRLIQLDNGLVLILREDHSAPVVSAQAWCKSGSIHEGRWLGAGMSHVLEHMLFKGTTTRGPSRIDQEVQEAGGYMNAYTSFDRTVYWINVPNTGAKVAVDILCDIMRNATLPAEELEKEKQVILREMDMNHDDPCRRASRRLFETAYIRSPYRFTVIGYPDIFNELKREDILHYYREQYSPNNIFFVVVGDIRAEEIEQQFRNAFAEVKAKSLAPFLFVEEPRQIAPRERIEEAAIELAYLHWSWHIPEITHPDIPLLDVLATVLGAGRSSRLYQNVREKAGLAHSVDAWTYNPGHPGLFGVSAIVESKLFKPLREAVIREVETVKSELIEPGELAKAIKQFTASTLGIRKTMQGQAQDLGASWIATHDLHFSQRYLAAVQRATPEELMRVAQAYIREENRTGFALVPSGSVQPLASNQSRRIEHAPIQKWDLPNGLRLLTKEDHRLPFVEIRMVFKGGVLVETAENNGTTLLLAKMLLKGTALRDAAQVVREIESVGGSIDTYAGNNSFGISLEVLSEDIPLGLELLSDVLLNAVFPEPALEIERQMQLAGIRSRKDQLLQSACLMMRAKLFGQRGYGMDILGQEETVSRVTSHDLRAWRQKLILPNNAVLAIFGDIHTETVRKKIEALFSNWLPGTPLSSDDSAPAIHQVQRIVERRPKKQAVLAMGYPGITLFSPDRCALELLQEACSDLGSRLFLRIREKLGLAYYVGAQNMIGLSPGYFLFYAGTEPEKAELVEKELLLEAEELRTHGLEAEELKRAKAKVIGQKKIARQDLGNLATTSALDELYGLGYNFSEVEDERFEGVTAEQIREAARRVLNPAGFTMASILPEPDKESSQPKIDPERVDVPQ